MTSAIRRASRTFIVDLLRAQARHNFRGFPARLVFATDPGGAVASVLLAWAARDLAGTRQGNRPALASV